MAGSATGKAEKNTVTLVDGNVSGNVYGSYASGGTSTVTKNTVTVSGGSVNGTIYGGFLASSTAPRDVAENTVTLTGEIGRAHV